MSENLHQLKEWHDLFEKGIISQEEYENKKREILNLPLEIKVAEPIQTLTPEGKTAETASVKTSTKIVQNKKSGLNVNHIFLIAFGALLLLSGGFWFWNMKKSSNSKDNIIDSVSVDQKNKLDSVSVDSVKDIVDNDVLQNKIVKEKTSKESKEEKWNSFIKEFKTAVKNRDYLKIQSMASDDFDFGGGYYESISDFLKEMYQNPDFENAAKFETYTDCRPTEDIYFRTLGPWEMGSFFFDYKDGKWYFSGIVGD